MTIVEKQMNPSEGAVRAKLPPYLELEELDAVILRALEEDIGPGDVTSQLTTPETLRADGRFVAKESGVLAGAFVASRVFHLLDASISLQWLCGDGSNVQPGETIGTIAGRTRSILTGERTALNFLQRMSGIATLTATFVQAVSGYGAEILDTRKTAPGLRLLDKWAVLLGGGINHRVGLYDMILIKDNHIAAAGSIADAIAAAVGADTSDAASRGRGSDALTIEVEAKTLVQVHEILRADEVDRILLDNMVTVEPTGTVDTSRLLEAVSAIAGRVETEASGNVSLQTVTQIAATGVDFISIGALTHSVSALDLSLRLDA